MENVIHVHVRTFIGEVPVVVLPAEPLIHIASGLQGLREGRERGENGGKTKKTVGRVTEASLNSNFLSYQSTMYSITQTQPYTSSTIKLHTTSTTMTLAIITTRTTLISAHHTKSWLPLPPSRRYSTCMALMT